MDEMGMSVNTRSSRTSRVGMEEDEDTLRGSRLVSAAAVSAVSGSASGRAGGRVPAPRRGGERADVSSGSWLADEGGFEVDDEHNDIRRKFFHENI